MLVLENPSKNKMPGVEGPIEEVLPDWPAGPLDYYRQQASFDWRKMKLLIEGEDCVRFKAKVWQTLGKPSLKSFSVKCLMFFLSGGNSQRSALRPRSLGMCGRNKSCKLGVTLRSFSLHKTYFPKWEEIDRLDSRRITFQRMKKLVEYEFLTEEEFLGNPMLGESNGTAVSHDVTFQSHQTISVLTVFRTGNAVGSITGQYDWALASKKFLAYEYFIGNARSIGSSSQNDFMNDVFQFKALGKFRFFAPRHQSRMEGEKNFFVPQNCVHCKRSANRLASTRRLLESLG